MRLKVTTMAMIVLLAGAAVAAENPIDKGSMMLDGAIYFRSQSGDFWEEDGEAVTTLGAGSVTFEANSVEVTPLFGYFVSPGVLIGGQLGFQSFSFGNDDLNIFAVGPTVGYYFEASPGSADGKRALYGFVRGFGSFGSMSDESDNSRTIVQLGGNVGLIYMLSTAVGADLSVKVQRDSWKRDSDPEAITGMTIQAGVGVTAFIF